MSTEPHDVAPVRVVFADDSAIYSSGLVRAMQASPDIVLVGLFDDGAPAAEAAVALTPDVVVLDYRMPGLDGLSAARRIRASGLGCRILLLSAFAEELSARLAAEGQADGDPAFDAVMDKARKRREILTKIRDLAALPGRS